MDLYSEVLALANAFKREGKGAEAFVRSCFIPAYAIPRPATAGAPPRHGGMTPTGPLPAHLPHSTPHRTQGIRIGSQEISGGQQACVTEIIIRPTLQKFQEALLSGVSSAVREALEILVPALKEVFRLSADAIARLLVQAAPYVGTSLAIFIAILLVVITVISGGAATSILGALLLAGVVLLDTVIEALVLHYLIQGGTLASFPFASVFSRAITEAALRAAVAVVHQFIATTGETPEKLGALIRFGIRCMGKTAEDWARVIVAGWAQAPIRPGLPRLITALRTELRLSAESIARLMAQQGIATADIVAAFLVGWLGMDAASLARVLKAMAVPLAEIGSTLREKLHASASTLASALKELGYSAADVALALRSAQYATADAATALKDVFSLGILDVARRLKAAGFPDVAGAVATAFGKAKSVVEQMLRAAGI